ncbi:hypothetical protein GWC95_04205 [Sediminibacterium roseum]|uniref:Chain length determinant protein n=1 Tax=Sediminibacterium roseum TaxID=1978412 RepID=A0ABW9ZPT9_9BACT|nr:hypothetical protein [Sediminibacterium roseum]NCI49112.1 hypothetical protein [Sediminibacterium roseum]
MSDLLDAIGRMVRFAARHFFKGVCILIAFVLLGTGYYFIQKPAYKSTVNFILDEKGSSMGGGLAGLASQFGLDLGSMSGSSGMLAGDNILDILKSRSVMETVLLTKVDSTKGQESETLADRYLDFSHLKQKWARKGEAGLSNIDFSKLKNDNASKHTILQDSVLFVLFERLKKKHVKADRLNKKGSIITVNTVAEDQVFSKLFSERLVDETRKLYISVKTSVSAANINRLQSRADSLQKVMNFKSYQTASLQIVDANTAFKAEAVPAEVTQRDRMVTYAIYTEVMKNLEASRMAMANQTPVIQILDSSKYPLENEKSTFLMILMLSIVAGLLVCGAFIFLFYPRSHAI